jgi:hypothetical protein
MITIRTILFAGGSLTTASLVAITILLAAGSARAGVRYVNASNASPTPPYTNWVTAATNIQDAVDAAAAGDEIMVTNGIYAPVTVNTPVALQSVNGPAVTVINGGGTARCLYLTNDAVMAGFTLTNGSILNSSGGGVSCGSKTAVLTNCVLSGNSAVAYGIGGGAYGGTLNRCTLSGNVAHLGGGAYNCTLNNCRLTGNIATTYGNSSAYGGGADLCTLNNCTLAGNQGIIGPPYGGLASGGGAYQCSLNNCIIYYNSAAIDGNFGLYCTLTNCCTTPLPANGVGNITNAPLFVDYAGGNLRLQTNSPCINTGNNAYAPGSADLDGRPRIVGGAVDMGTYEFQGPGLGEFISWLQYYGLPTDGSADYADSDGDGVNNWQEYQADTSPLDASDYLHITSFARSGTYNTLWWTGKSTRLYRVERRANLDAASPWETIITNAVSGWNNVGFDNMGPQYFYRIRAVRP